jgi:cephalosporin hydroxylase
MGLLTSLRYRCDNLLGRVELRRERATVRRFHRLYYFKKPKTWADTRFLGVPTAKNPLDLWVYQEILFETRPDVIVETGTAHGGSALFMASVCDLLGRGRVISVDLRPQPNLPAHDRVTYLTGSSVAPEVAAAVRGQIPAGARVMIVLDSDHSEAHVLEELKTYAPLVTPGCYAVVEDSNVNGHPVFLGHGPGPAEAVRRFLSSDDSFTVDRSREKFMFTFNPGGYLRRTA